MFTKTDIETYFLAEKSAALFIVIVGIISIVAAAIFFAVIKTNFFKGAALVFLLVGLLELIAGIVVYRKSDTDRLTQVYAYDMNPSQIQNKELPRMKKVNRSFKILTYAELILGLAGIILFFTTSADPGKKFFSGLALALILQMVIVFWFDAVAEKRANQYTRGLEEFVQSR